MKKKTKIKIKIETPSMNLKLPSMPLWIINNLLFFALKQVKDESLKVNIKQNKGIIKKMIKELNQQLDHYESFTLVEIIDKENHIKIDVI